MFVPKMKTLNAQCVTSAHSNLLIGVTSLLTFITSDIDECSADSTPCDESADCTNSEGSYSCTCKQGFDGDGTVCEGKSNI